MSTNTAQVNTPNIHPTAVIGAGAQIADDVSIGPYSIVEDDVKIGAGSKIAAHVVIKNHTYIGQQNEIFQFCSLGEDPQHQGYKGEPTLLYIGDRNVIREYCTINRGTVNGLGKTQVGNDNFIMAYTHIAHDCVLNNHIIFANGASLAGHVEIADHAILGGFTMVHQFCNVGQYSMTGIGCVCTQDVPPYCTVAGNPARAISINKTGLLRHGFTKESMCRLHEAYRLIFRSELGLQQAIQKVQSISENDPAISAFIRALVKSSQGRGFIKKSRAK